MNILVTGSVFLFFVHVDGNDFYSYDGLAEGILHGRYSFWWFLHEYLPDTFRNPGYPLFLASIKWVINNKIVVKFTQLILYALSVKWTLSLLGVIFENSYRIKNIFLILLIPCVYIGMYACFYLPEMLTLFLLTLFLYTYFVLQIKDIYKYFFLGLIAGALFQVRPVFIFLPIIFFIFDGIFFKMRQKITKHIILVLVYLLTMLPYAYWNYRHHKVFKITSLEGGAGVLHLGYWAPKLPDYFVSRYWNNRMGNEYVQFVDKEEIESNISRFNAEYDEIESECKHFQNTHDIEIHQIQKQYPELPHTFKSEYTLKRESMLTEKAFQNYRNDIGYTLKIKIYTFFRLWVTGVNKTDFEKEKSVFRKLVLIYPFSISFVMFVLFLFSLPFLLVKMKVKKVYFLVSILLYIGLMYVPFTIQARYTIPVRLIQIMLISGVINWLLDKYAFPKTKIEAQC